MYSVTKLKTQLNYKKMNVHEIIDWLQQIENKSLPVGYITIDNLFEEIEIIKENSDTIELI